VVAKKLNSPKEKKKKDLKKKDSQEAEEKCLLPSGETG